MCYGSSEVRPSSKSNTAVLSAPAQPVVTAPASVDPLASIRPTSGLKRFRSGGLVYLLGALGPLTFYTESSGETEADAEESSDYRGEHGQWRFVELVSAGRITLINPAPTQPVQQTVDTRTDRLAAAEEDTGVKLGAKVDGIFEDLKDAVVVGFARIDEHGNSGVRKVVVRHSVVTTTLFDAVEIFTL